MNGVNRLVTPPVSTASSQASCGEVEVKSLLDAVVKLITGKITVAEFRECRIWHSIVFDKESIEGEVVPALKEGARKSPKEMYAALAQKDANGTSLCAALITSETGATVLGELIPQLSVDQRREILGGQGLFADVAATTGSGDDKVDAAARQIYKLCDVKISPQDVVDVLAKRIGHTELHGYGLGTLMADQKEENSKITVAKMLVEIEYDPNKPLTPEQATKFAAWLDNSFDNQNAFLSTLGSSKFMREYVGAFCDALYDIDEGKTLSEMLSAQCCEENSYGPDFPGAITLGHYAKIEGFSDAVCERLDAMYKKCDLNDLRNAIATAPDIGIPFLHNTEKQFGACTSVIISNLRTTHGAPMAIKGEGVHSARPLYNMRQIGRLKSVENVSFDAHTSGITEDDLMHMCKGVKGLKRITLSNANQVGAKVTEGMIRTAIERSGRSDIELVIQ
ncbi:MAG: hypothetical protein LBD72_00110 [Puniceicoccales bacterium]|jgi:hypothetical protein|nr:hypothetical protein [Puniceicoccales bacterium]